MAKKYEERLLEIVSYSAGFGWVKHSVIMRFIYPISRFATQFPPSITKRKTQSTWKTFNAAKAFHYGQQVFRTNHLMSTWEQQLLAPPLCTIVLLSNSPIRPTSSFPFSGFSVFKSVKIQPFVSYPVFKIWRWKSRTPAYLCTGLFHEPGGAAQQNIRFSSAPTNKTTTMARTSLSFWKANPAPQEKDRPSSLSSSKRSPKQGPPKYFTHLKAMLTSGQRWVHVCDDGPLYARKQRNVRSASVEWVWENSARCWWFTKHWWTCNYFELVRHYYRLFAWSFSYLQWPYLLVAVSRSAATARNSIGNENLWFLWDTSRAMLRNPISWCNASRTMPVKNESKAGR